MKDQLPHLDQIKLDLRKGLEDQMTSVSSLKTLRHYAALGFEYQVAELRFDVPIVWILTGTDGISREAALKTLQGLLANQKTLFPKSCLRCLVSIAESPNDPLRLVANEMLFEAAVIDPLKAFENGVIKYLFSSLVEGPKELLDGLLLTLLYLLDSAETRRFVRPNVELEMIISFFSDFNINSKNDEQKLVVGSRVLNHLMKSWTGMLYLFGSDPETIKSVISSLKVPVKSYREHLIGTFYSIIALPDESDPSIYSKRPNLVFIFHFKALVVILLLDAGLLDSLVDISIDDSIKQSILKIFGELSKYIPILPLKYAQKVQSLSKFISAISDFHNKENRHISSIILSELETVSRLKERESFNYPLKLYKEYQLMFDRIKENADEFFIKNLVNETKVLEPSSSHEAWNWDSIYELIKTLQMNPRRLDEVFKLTKFFRRILSYYRPLSLQFSELPNNDGTMPIYVSVILELLDLLFHHVEGLKLLEDHKLFPEIGDCLVQIIQSGNANSSSLASFFSIERLKKTLSSEYFTILGKVLNHPIGARVLEENRLINVLYSLTFSKNRDDVAMLIISKMDCYNDGHSRLLLTRYLSSGNRSIRKYAMEYLGEGCMNSKLELNWAIGMLVALLYDAEIEIARYAVLILDNLCQLDPNIIKVIIKTRPIFSNVEEFSFTLKTRLLRESAGFEFLSKLDFIEFEITEWHKTGNARFVVCIELYLEELLVSNSFATIGKSKFMPYLSKMPAHFFGELCHTLEGCNLLKKKGYMLDLIQQVRGWKSLKIIDLKSALWALGYIFSSKNGSHFIRYYDGALKELTEIVRDHSCLSVRGTCFYVLGLIGQTEEGSLALEELGWVAVAHAKRFCFPNDLKFILQNIHNHYEISDKLYISSKELAKYNEILENINNLSNHILSNSSSKKLIRMRMAKPECFNDPRLFMEVFKMLESYHFRLPARKFIQEVLFDKLTFDESTWKVIDAS